MTDELKLFSFIENSKPEPEHCIGLFFRASRDCWAGSDGDINFRMRFRPLWKRSCPGCEQCDWLSEQLYQDLSELSGGEPGFNSTSEPDPNYFVHGGVYQYKVTGVGTDWETGYVDEVNLEFVLVENDYGPQGKQD